VTKARALMVVLLLGSGCASMLPAPVAKDVEWLASRGTRRDLAELSQGRSAYVQRCAGCHNLHSPAMMGPEQWASVVGEMEQDKDVRLDRAERELIVAYLSAASARLRSTTPE